jgi:hypothetical protein
VRRLGGLNRRGVREGFERGFTAGRMAADYNRHYQMLVAPTDNGSWRTEGLLARLNGGVGKARALPAPIRTRIRVKKTGSVGDALSSSVALLPCRNVRAG